MKIRFMLTSLGKLAIEGQNKKGKREREQVLQCASDKQPLVVIIVNASHRYRMLRQRFANSLR